MLKLFSSFTENIAPCVEAELAQAGLEAQKGDADREFSHLENAHVLGQESTYWHVKAHWRMLCWAIRQRQLSEAFGQCFRIIGAATKTAFGLVPQGNTGGANVSPFKVMPIQTVHAEMILKAKHRR